MESYAVDCCHSENVPFERPLDIEHVGAKLNGLQLTESVENLLEAGAHLISCENCSPEVNSDCFESQIDRCILSPSFDTRDSQRGKNQSAIP